MQDLTLPSVGLIASGKLSHGRVQAGQGWGEKTASMPFSYTHTHMYIMNTCYHRNLFLASGSEVQMDVMKQPKEELLLNKPYVAFLRLICETVPEEKTLPVHLLLCQGRTNCFIKYSTTTHKVQSNTREILVVFSLGRGWKSKVCFTYEGRSFSYYCLKFINILSSRLLNHQQTLIKTEVRNTDAGRRILSISRQMWWHDSYIRKKNRSVQSTTA